MAKSAAASPTSLNLRGVTRGELSTPEATPKDATGTPKTYLAMAALRRVVPSSSRRAGGPEPTSSGGGGASSAVRNDGMLPTPLALPEPREERGWAAEPSAGGEEELRGRASPGAELIV